MQDYDRQDILVRVRQALALHRQVGFTFPGHFLRLPPDLTGDPVQTTINAMPHCLDENGEIDLISIGIFMDIAMSRSIRGAIKHYGRMATSNINLALRGGSRRGHLTANGHFLGYFAGSEAKQ